MALTELKGKALGTQKVVIERGPVKVFAQALLDDDPVYAERGSAGPADVPVRDAVLGLDGPGRRGRAADREPARQGPRDPARRAGVRVPRRPLAARRRRARRRRRRSPTCTRRNDPTAASSSSTSPRRRGRTSRRGEPGRHHEVHARRSSASPTPPSRSRSRNAWWPYTPEQLSDRAEIHDVIDRYGWSIDTQRLGRCSTRASPTTRTSTTRRTPAAQRGPVPRGPRAGSRRSSPAFAVMQHLMVEHRRHARR